MTAPRVIDRAAYLKENHYMKVNRYGFLSVAEDETPEGPKNETLAEHREHCRAKPGNCPFEKRMEKEGEKEDTIAKTAPAAGGTAESDKPKDEPQVDLGKTAAVLSAAFASAAKSMGKDFYDEKSFMVEPSKTWDPETKTEKPTGGFQFTAAVKGNGEACNAFLDKLNKVLGVSRKQNDCYPGDDASRINTHVTAEEAKGALGKIEELKVKAAEKAKSDAEAAEKSKQSAKVNSALQMATFAITDGAKTVNFHAKQGDFAPNKAKVDGAIMAGKDVQSLLDGGGLDDAQKKQAEALLKAVGEIQSSYYDGKHNEVSMVPQMEQPKPKTPAPKENPKPAAEGGKGGEGGKKPSADLSSIYAGLLGAAKTINYHIQAHDNKPNPSKIAAMKEAAKALHDLCPDGKTDDPDVKALLGTMKEIAASAKSGWKKPISFMKPLKGVNGGAGAAPKPSSPIDGLLGMLKKSHGFGGGGAPDHEADDAYEYDEGRWAHMAWTGDNDPSYMKKLTDSLSDEDCEKIFADEGVVTTLDGAASLVKAGFPQFYANKVTCNHAPLKDAAMAKESLKCAAACLKDLHERFPNMAKCHLQSIFPSKAKNLNTAAEWVKGDEDNPDNYSSICFHADYDEVAHAGSYSYGHADSRYPSDVFRHEYMHGIATGAVAKAWKKFIGETYGKPCTGFFKLMKDKVSKYAASGDIYESVAETFSMMTSHDYKPGTLPRPVEDFIYGKVLGCKPMESHQHLMYDPEELKSKSKPKAAQKETDTKMDDIISWFGEPEETKTAEKQTEKAQPVKAPLFAFA